MDTTSVIINDYVVGRQSSICLLPEHFEKVAAVWNTTDRLIVEMQSSPLFAGKFLWSDLSPIHFRAMIVLNLVYHSELPSDERINPKNPTVQSLYFLIACLVYCIAERAESNVDLLRLYRVEEMAITYNFSASMRTVMTQNETRPSLRIVSNNE